MNALEFESKQQTMSDKELIENVKEQISELARKWLRTQMTVNRREETKPTDEDIENASNDYLNDIGNVQRNNPTEEIRFAYQEGAKDMRNNNIHIAIK